MKHIFFSIFLLFGGVIHSQTINYPGDADLVKVSPYLAHGMPNWSIPNYLFLSAPLHGSAIILYFDDSSDGTPQTLDVGFGSNPIVYTDATNINSNLLQNQIRQNHPYTLIWDATNNYWHILNHSVSPAPKFISQLTNDVGYLTNTTTPVTSVSGKTGAVSLVKADVGLSLVDNTSDLNKPVSTATQTALNTKEPTITAGTTAQYWRGDKTWQTLPIGWSITGNTGTSATTDFVGTIDAVDFVTRTNNIERLRVTSAGNVGIGTTSPTSTFQVNGSAAYPIVTTATALTLTGAHKTVVVTSAATAITITLPNPTTCTGREYTISRGAGSIGTVTISGTSIQSLTTGTYGATTTLGGIGTYTGRATFQSNGTTWIYIR